MSKKIQRISKNVAERISTAQVVVSLSSALRQLIDNSIDAGATVIDIRCKNNGFESVEVQDNGSGIEARNFDALCKPHSTSKLTEFSDFDKLVTLGFRGEALNALCAISSVTVFTRSPLADLGSRLTFDHQGTITNLQSAAREKGTTILVERLFESLPVRRKELERNSKREFIKMLRTIQSFAILCPQIKFLCSNIIPGGKKVHAICTPGGNSSIQDVVLNLFGGSNGLALSKIHEDSPNEEILTMYSVPPADRAVLHFIQLHGFVSSCEHGCGRSTSDRQFVYINNRPVKYSRVCSIINEVYKQFNKSQYPVIVLFIDVPLDKIDVNVTPDKKTVMVEKERYLFAMVRASILTTMNGIVGAHSTVKSSVEDKRNAKLDESFDWEGAENTENQGNAMDSTLNSTLNSSRQEDTLMNVADLLKKKKSLRSSSPPAKKQCNASVGPSFVRKPMEKVEKKGGVPLSRKLDDFYTATVKVSRDVRDPPAPATSSSNLLTDKDQSIIDDVEEQLTQPDSDDVEFIGQASNLEQDSQLSSNFRVEDLDNNEIARPQQTVKFSMKTLRDTYVKSNPSEKPHKEDVLDELTTGITDDGLESERQLSRSLQKSDFLEMEVVGQFNKGFIICSLRSHLFIVDQHASDEKYNFERLKEKAKLTKQPLLNPTPLSFGTVQEMLIRENLHIFQANGFDFDFRENDGGLKTFLTARPVIMSQQLTNTDLEEILAVVSEYPYQMYRPLRIRNIFASRACRKSVMIGKSLNSKEMSKIIRHLAKLDQPWNCPHGRPTIRHLATLKNDA